MRKIAYHLALFFLLTGLLTACQQDAFTPEHESGVNILPNGKLRIPMALSVPQMRQAVVNTRTTVEKTGDETLIGSIWVAVFEATGATPSPNDRLLQLQRGAVNAEESLVAYTQTYVDLDQYGSPCYLRVVANISQGARDKFETLVTIAEATPENPASTLGGLDTLEIALTELYENANNPGGTIANINYPLPMVSDLHRLEEISIASTTNLSIGMRFSFARIDVDASAVDKGTATGGNFTIKSARLLNGSKMGDLFETQETVNSGGVITYQDVQANSGSAVVSPIYLYSNAGAQEGQAQGTNPTDVLICGDYTAPNGTTYSNGYYKVRMHYDQGGTDTYDIKTNTLYTIKINKVKGPGYENAEDAIARNPHNLDYETNAEDASPKDFVIANGEYYLGVSNSEYIIFANEAMAVNVVTLTHNAPATVATPTVTITGNGMSLFASEGLTLTSGTTATLPTGNGEEHSYSIKLNMTATATSGALTIRIGNLLKTIQITKKPLLGTTGETGTIPATDIGGSDFEWIKSESTRITVNNDNSLTAKTEARNNLVLSTVKAFDKDKRGNVVIAVKRLAQEVVYYEKYGDGSYGVFFEPISTLTSDIRDDKIIIEAGYGVLKVRNESTSFSISRNVSNTLFDTYTITTPVITTAGFTDYAGSLYPVNQSNIITPETQATISRQVKINNVVAQQYIYPNYAKGVYSNSTTTILNSVATPFLIRTPLQFRNIDRISGNISQAFKQEVDLDFSQTEIGGATFTRAIIKSDGYFNGNYDGGSKEIRKVEINSTSISRAGLFCNMQQGTIKNITLVDSRVIMRSNGIAAIVASMEITGDVQIDNIFLKKVTVNGSRSNNADSDAVETAGIVGVINSGSNNSATVTISNCETDADCTIIGQGSDRYSGTAGMLGSTQNFYGQINIINCTNRATIRTTALNFGVASGILGEIYNTPKVIITNCKNYGNISTSAATSGIIYSYLASVAGILAHSERAAAGCVIENCENYGVIDGGNGPAGGIIGHIAGAGTWDIRNCTNRGEVKSSGSAAAVYRYSGGIAASIRIPNVTIQACTNLGVISGGSHVGGIVADYNSEGVLSNVQVIDTRINPLTSFISSNYNYGSTKYLGGIVAYGSCSIYDACVIDARTSPTVPFFADNGTGASGMGGIIGQRPSETTAIERVLFLARMGSSSRPIDGFQTSNTNTYFLQGTGFNTGTAGGGGTGQTTDAFGSTPNVSTSPWNTNWERVDGYPYPKLKSFAIPAAWPVVN